MTGLRPLEHRNVTARRPTVPSTVPHRQPQTKPKSDCENPMTKPSQAPPGGRVVNRRACRSGTREGLVSGRYAPSVQPLSPDPNLPKGVRPTPAPFSEVCSFRLPKMCSFRLPLTHWTPSPCTRLSRARTTTGPPPHSAGVNRRQVFPALLAGTNGVVPTFTLEPFNGVGAQLCPCNLATATPQSFTMASLLATSTSPRVPRPARPVGCALQPSPHLSGWSWWFALEGLSAAGSSRTPFRLACRTHAI